jgi:Skp family chaperone for outer membrane proteins
MSREAFGDPPESQEPPDLCPVCGNDWHAEDCEFGKEVARRLKAERDAHKLAFENEQLRRETKRLQGLLDAVSKIAEELARPSGI